MAENGSAMPKLVLIDAYSQIFRAFYAIRKLTNAKGEPVNAAFVFTKLLLKLDSAYPSAHGAMLFDCGKVKFRTDIHPEYKANRPPMPDDLKVQMPLIREIASAFGWELLQCDGWEADDLIGGMTKKFSDFFVQIVSSDKDLSQLVDERVEMLVPSTAGFDKRDTAGVLAKFGIAPELIVDYLALLGDASDNIPGVPGIGPKSAVELLTGYGAAETWLDDLEKLTGCKFLPKLLPNLEVLKRNRELITLRTELPDAAEFSRVPQRKTPDWKKIRTICEQNQFNSILRELPAPATSDDFGEDDLFAFAAAAAVPEDDAAPDEPAAGEVVQPELF